MFLILVYRFTVFATSFSETQAFFRDVVTLIVLLASLYVILSRKYIAKVEHWAYAMVGTVLGFWLRG